jgi:predicted N-acetyltransferase YhbS
MFTLTPERPEDGPAIEALLDRAFGSERTQKTSYRFRDGVEPIANLRWVARGAEGEVLGTIRYWPIRVISPLGERDALLLGPIAVEPALKGKGIGRALIRNTLDMAAQAGHRLVLLVGDPDYYEAFGFVPAAARGFVMPNEKPGRLQALALAAHALEGGGTLRPWGWVRRQRRRVAA